MVVASLLYNNSTETELNNIIDIIKFIFDFIFKHLSIICVTWKRKSVRRLKKKERTYYES